MPLIVSYIIEIPKENNLPSQKKLLSKEEIQQTVQQNKTREKCVICGKKTERKDLFLSCIQYCPCTEKINKATHNIEENSNNSYDYYNDPSD